MTKYRRDFLTAALLDQAVQQAAITCSRRQAGGDDDAVLDRETLMTAIDDQVRGVVDRLHESNTHHYVDLPDSVRVASVRRLPRPTMQPFTIERVA